MKDSALIPYDILLQSNNKILIAAEIGDLGVRQTVQDFLVLRINADGGLDSSFGENNGRTSTDFSDINGGTSYDIPFSVDLQSDGNIILGRYQ